MYIDIGIMMKFYYFLATQPCFSLVVLDIPVAQKLLKPFRQMKICTKAYLANQNHS